MLGGKTKVGHGGTLDSTASGLLVLLVGCATRACAFVHGLAKIYAVEAQLGAFSDTEDASGRISQGTGWDHVDHETLEKEILGFLGTRFQAPPAISAVHVSGRRAHELARSGEKVSPSPRPVTVTSLSGVTGPDPKGRIAFSVKCHKGTYIRSLVRDLGNRLGCGAYVHSLRRLSIGKFCLDRSVSLSSLETGGGDAVLKFLLPLESLLNISCVTRPRKTWKKMSATGGSSKPVACPGLTGELSPNPNMSLSGPGLLLPLPCRKLHLMEPPSTGPMWSCVRRNTHDRSARGFRRFSPGARAAL